MKDYGLFIDGFSGPGEYTKGEPGSPLIAIRTLQEHSAFDDLKHKIRFRLIEARQDRSDHLESLIKRESILSSEQIEVRNSTFDADMSRFLDQLDNRREKPPPMFVMIDPFGFSDAPMDTIRRILRNESAEVYISFMYRDINRFLTDPGKEHALNLHFGGTEWQESREIDEEEERKDFLLSLYRSQLKKAGAEFVLHFDLYQERAHIYTIFFGTNSLKGSDEMKKAIWRVMPLGDFRFRGARIGQGVFEGGLVDYSELQEALRGKFDSDEWTTFEAIKEYVMSAQTGFHSGQLKAKTLKPMEDRRELEVRPGSRIGSSGYPEGTLLRFRDPPPNPQPRLV